MSDTPLTDAILEDEGKCNTYYAYVTLCRSLERENAALKEEIAALKKEIAALTFRADSAEAELRLYHKIVRTGRG